MYHSSLVSIAKRLHSLFALSIRHIANLLNISKSTIHRWLSLTKSELVSSERSRMYSVDISQLPHDNPFLSLRDYICKHQLKMSVSTLCRYMKADGFSKQKVKTIGSTDEERIRNLRIQFSNKVKEIDLSSSISVDETSVYVCLNPLRAWSRKSEPVTIPLQKKRSQRYTLTMGVTTDGLTCYTLHKGSSNAKRFREFLETLKDYPHKYVLMDNVQFHKTKDITNYLQSIGKEPLFSAPYSPEWNPVERVFAIFKSHMRKNYLSKTSNLESSVVEFLRKLSPETCKNIFRRVNQDIMLVHHR